MSTIHRLTGPLEQSRGVIGRYPRPDEQYRFEFGSVGLRSIHMVGVRRPLRVGWYVDGELRQEEVLRPWLGFAAHRADLVIETHPSANLPNNES